MKKIIILTIITLNVVACNQEQHHDDHKGNHDKKHNMKQSKKMDSSLSLKEIMQDLAIQLERLQHGILYNNRYMVKTAAYGIAHHPAPKDGIKPYLRKNAAKVKSKIPAIDKKLHGAAKILINNVDNLSFIQMQKNYNNIAQSCVSCHNMFRDL